MAAVLLGSACPLCSIFTPACDCSQLDAYGEYPRAARRFRKRVYSPLAAKPTPQANVVMVGCGAFPLSSRMLCAQQAKWQTQRLPKAYPSQRELNPRNIQVCLLYAYHGAHPACCCCGRAPALHTGGFPPSTLAAGVSPQVFHALHHRKPRVFHITKILAIMPYGSVRLPTNPPLRQRNPETLRIPYALQTRLLSGFSWILLRHFC